MTSSNSSANAEQFSPGKVLDGKYELLRVLGSGGMGLVYEARHTLVERRVAVKLLKAGLAQHPQLLERFSREARTAGSLECENIASVHDFGVTAEGTPFIVMERLLGSSWRALLQERGVLSVRRVASLGIQVCWGLSKAHGQGIVHRDLKPENLFIARREDGSDLLKILDFGIAKLLNDAAITLSDEGSALLGTIPYMPPEQIRGANNVDHRADIYALGAILYESLAGEVPHASEDRRAILYHALHEPFRPLLSLRPELPRGLCEGIEKALAPERGDRFETALDFAVALSEFGNASVRRWVSNPPASHKKQADVPIPVTSQDHATETNSSMGAPPVRRRGRALKAGLLAASLLAVASLVGWSFLREGNGVDPFAGNAQLRRSAPADVPLANSVVAREEPAAEAALDESKSGPPEVAPPLSSDPPASAPSPASRASLKLPVRGRERVVQGATNSPPAVPTALGSAPHGDAALPSSPTSSPTSMRRAAQGHKRQVEFDLTVPYD